MKISEKIQNIIKIMQPDDFRTAIAGNEYECQYFVYLEYSETRLDILCPEDKYNIERLLGNICDEAVFFIIEK